MQRRKNLFRLNVASSRKFFAVTLTLFCPVLILTLFSTSADAATVAVFSSDSDDPAERDGLGWLDSQARTNCVQSFEGASLNEYVGTDAYWTLVTPQKKLDWAFTYDQALAAMVYILNENDAEGRAHKILAGLQEKQNADGSWATAYRCEAEGLGDVAEPFNDVGPTAWVALAALNYMDAVPADRSFDQLVVNAVSYVSANQWKREWGGDGGVNVASNRLQTAASTEHNLDAYALLKRVEKNPDLMRVLSTVLTHEFSVEATRANVYAFLTETAWKNTDLGPRFVGGRGDNRLPLDVVTWGNAALLDDFDQATFAAVATLVEEKTPVYGSSNELDFVAQTDRLGTDPMITGNEWWNYFSAEPITIGELVLPNDREQDAWYEGMGQAVISLQLASASYASRGWSTTAIQAQIEGILDVLSRAENVDGALPYSARGTNNTYFRMLTSPSVSATAWSIFASVGYNPFYGLTVK